LAGVEPEALIVERDVNGTAEGHELGFDASEMGKSTHVEEHVFEKAAADGGLRMFCGDVKAADEAFLLFEDVEGIASGGAIFESDTSGESVGFEEALDEFEGTAIIPMKVIAPVAGFFFKKRLQLAYRGLTEIDDVHGESGDKRDPCRAD
jgi:hypothetical protein